MRGLSDRARGFGGFWKGWESGFVHPGVVFCNGVRRKFLGPRSFEVFSFGVDFFSMSVNAKADVHTPQRLTGIARILEKHFVFVLIFTKG